MADMQEQRLNMVESQVRPSDVTDRRIIRAMGQIAREAFVPAAYRSTAYRDEAVPLATGRPDSVRRLMAPRSFAKLVQLADISDRATVLVIGCGSGYSLAVIARLAAAVVGVEPDAGLAEQARATLKAQGVSNVDVVVGSAHGHVARGPYDAILVEGAFEEIPPALLDQLKDGGLLVGVLNQDGQGKAVAWRRNGRTYAMREGFDLAADPLPGFQKARSFAL
jgi:protein-L-isoaspartate(D-aspartate) O-methyltransferase